MQPLTNSAGDVVIYKVESSNVSFLPPQPADELGGAQGGAQLVEQQLDDQPPDLIDDLHFAAASPNDLEPPELALPPDEADFSRAWGTDAPALAALA